jgi:hypothetical protein
MTTLEMNKIHTHTPLVSAISTHNEIAYTICVECDQNIESFYIEFDNDRLGRWSKWAVSV